MARRRGSDTRRDATRSSQAAQTRLAARDAIVADGRITYATSLPISQHRDELVAAIRDHQVVVVAGETGSGKSTQLPKLCLEAGRGVNGLIGHTQPRRVAARTIAARVAEELGSTLGEEVGYTVRFADNIGERTLIRVMTDGVLLAELQRDRLLRRYDTIIIDEAHERSLNIDFLLGYLAQLLPKRPDLRIIVTSATIDTERFARHFARDGVVVPVVEVAGRTFPVEVRYEPFGVDDDDDRDQVQAICDAVDDLAKAGPGDVLVFVSGEREIHDTADALRRSVPPDTDVLALYARLSSGEQQRIFEPHTRRRVVLSTNVAETSLTVPGVRYVVDAGNARISRYSRRLKVQRLPIEPISRASANQRAGRCGRVAPGICIRLYAEEDFDARPAFTEPEILRTNLASVILQMTAIGLGDVAAFPFVEPPDSAAIRDGYSLLDELGALHPAEPDQLRRLTEMGRRLARLPVDPRLGRMVLEAEQRNCVHDVMVIVAALSIQDPRERPQEKRQQADELHRRFNVAGSELLGLLALWNYLRDQQRAMSSNQFRKLCRAEFLNYLRVREWQDLFSQLRRAMGDLGIRPGAEAGHPDHVHQSMLAGLLSQIGMRDGETRTFRGPRGVRFGIAPGSSLARKPPRWVMAAELVETNQIWARRVAAIQPEWAEQLAPHLVKYSYGDPRWDAQRGAAVTTETVTLYGLPIITGRTVPFDRVDANEARLMFIQHALVDRDWRTHHAFVEHNAAFVERVEKMQARVRREDLLDDATIEAFFEDRVDQSVVSGRHFDRWWKQARRSQPDLLDFTDDLVAQHSGIRFADFPDTWSGGGLTLPLTYRFDPGGPLDGVNLHVPLTALNQLRGDLVEWQIPGHRHELVGELVRMLPKDVRRDLSPLNETIRTVYAQLGEPHGHLTDALADAIARTTGVDVPLAAFDVERVAPHLRMHFIVADDAGDVVDADVDLDTLRRRLARPLRAAIAAAVPLAERTGLVDWDIDAVPRVVRAARHDHVVTGYPALLDDGPSVSLRIFTNPATQQRAMRGGVRRLLQLTAAPSPKLVARAIEGNQRLAVAGHAMTFDDLVEDCIAAATDRVVLDAAGLPWDRESFDALREDARERIGPLAGDALRHATTILHRATRLRVMLDRTNADTMAASITDAKRQLARLVRKGFVRSAGTSRLPDVLRYVKGIEYRVERLADDIARDQRRMVEVLPLEQRYASFVSHLSTEAITSEIIEHGWLLEELRISVFAQPLGARGGVSTTRMRRDLDALGG
jgi:ATP-dependent helicase HrpA